jgi:tetratricopeptide (TPR) repeat protein
MGNVMANYQCHTYGDCDRAKSHEIFVRSPGDDLRCPDCKEPLKLQDAPRKSPLPTRQIIATAVGIAVLALAGAGFYLHGRGGQPGSSSSHAGASAVPGRPASSSKLADATPASAVRSPAPNTASGPVGIGAPAKDIAATRKQGDEMLIHGDAAGAETASNEAAANEMIKVAIADMKQGKLDDAEKALDSALARDSNQSLIYYNLGVLRLKQGRTNDALAELELSFQHGFRYFNQMDKDSDIDGIRDNPRFVAMLKKYRQAAA